MRTSIRFNLAILILCVVASGVLLAFTFFHQVFADYTLTASSLSPTATIEEQIIDLTHRVETLEHNQAYQLRDFAWKLDQKLYIVSGIAFVISIIATFFGIKTYKDLDKVIRDKISSKLDEELYQLDPTMLEIRVRSGRDLEQVHKRLQLTGLKNLKWYDDFGKSCLKGVTIVPIENDDDEKEFQIFLENYKKQLDPTRAAFILYAPNKTVSDKTKGAFENLVSANFPVTVASMVLVVGRGLKPPN